MMPRLRRSKRELYVEPCVQDVTLGLLLAKAKGEVLTEDGYLARHRAEWETAQKRTPAQKGRDEARMAALLEAAQAESDRRLAAILAGENID